MRNLKKFLALVLAMMMVFSLMVTVNAATVSASDYQAAYKQLANYGVFQGGTGADKEDINGKYTRAQMSTVVYRLMTGDTTGDGAIPYADYAAERFDDVKATDWYAPYVGWAANANVVIGYPNGNFGPNDNVTGFQTALMLLRTLGRDYYREYTDAKDWQLEVGRDSRQLGILQNADIGQLTGDATRGLAAYLVNNAVKYPYIVVHSGNGTYTSTGKKLISVNSTPREQDVWGVWGTTTNFSFNWPDQPVASSYFEEDEALAVFYSPVTECDAADAADIDAGTFVTYTNGKQNVGSQYINDLNTVNFIGAQGRETRIYSDYIVYKDTVLVESNGLTAGANDSAGHTYSTVTSSATVYGNTNMQGAVNGATSGTVLTGAGTALNSTSYTVSGNYAKGTVLRANVLTGVTGNTLAGTAPTLKSGVTRLQKAAELTAVPVTVAAIIYDNTTGSSLPVGFVGTNGTSYLYDVTFGYNSVSNPTDATRLVNTDINKTFNVYYWTATDSVNGTCNNVLGLAPANNTAANYGVVTGQRTITVDNPNSLTEIYAVEYTVLLADNSTATYRTLNFVGGQYKPYDSSTLSGASSLIRKLVKIDAIPTAAGYYTLTDAQNDVAPTAAISPAATVPMVYAGDADTLNNGVLVDDNTVFFVAQYTMGNANADPGAYNTNGYIIYNGFKNLPYDMAYGNNTTTIWENGTRIVNAGSDLDVYTFTADGTGDGTGTAKYVLILNATEKTPITDRAQTVQKYAYVLSQLNQSTVYDQYYLFNAVLDGSKTTLQLNNVAGKTVTDSGSGLYMYRPDSTNGYNAIVGTNAVNHVTGGWAYNAGVLTLNSAVNPNGVAANTVLGWNNTYYTVANGVQTYIVNPANGNVFTTSYDLDTLASLYSEMYFQLNQYGWISLVYVVDRNNSGPAPTPSTDITINYTINQYNQQTNQIVATYTYTDDTQVAATTITVDQSFLRSLLAAAGISNTNTELYGVNPATITVALGGTYNVTINYYVTAS